MNELKTVFDKTAIARRINEMGAEINKLYNNEPLAAICVLKGAALFFADLTRAIAMPKLEMDFVRLASYGKSDTSSGNIVFGKDVEIDLQDKHVLIVEDIVDSGRTMEFLISHFRTRNPLTLRIAALVDKHERRETDTIVDFAGFYRRDGFLVGYGMDYAEMYRSLPEICELVL